MKLTLAEGFFISDIARGDEAAYVEHFKERQIADQTLNIPFPYSAADADWWVSHVASESAQLGRSVNWAIRRADGYLVGGIGFHNFAVGAHKAELGYWLAKPYWGKGIMSETVAKTCEYGFREIGLVRITANVFIFNEGSSRVLEKAGFQLEGILRKHYQKNGKIFDGKLYAKVLL